MKAYFVKTEKVDNLESANEQIGNLAAALGRMVEYSKFMAKESGYMPRMEYVDTILEECDIVVEEIDQDSSTLFGVPITPEENLEFATDATKDNANILKYMETHTSKADSSYEELCKLAINKEKE